MQDNFDPILAFTLAYEGGRADDPRDPGGRTNQGVTQRVYAAYRASAGEGEGDVFAMTAAERTAIYRTRYWDAIGGAALPSGVDLACFDFAVNSGPARAAAALKRASAEATPRGDAVALVKALCTGRLGFLQGLSTYMTFGRGWSARVAACEALGVKMALHARVGRPVADPPSRGAALVLTSEARTAAARSAAQVRAAKATGAAAAVAAATPALLPDHFGWLAALGGIALALAVTVLLLWRAHRQAARATAYAAVAKSA